MTRAHILVQALSGQGKTFWSTLGGKPFILAPEQKCRAIIPLINPQAKVFPLDTKEDYDKAFVAVQSQKLVDSGYTRIVLDSFSELTEFIPGWFGMGFPLQIQDYGTIGNKAMALVLAMLKSPLPGIVICRSEAKEQGKVSRVVPGSLGKSAANLPAKLILTAETRHDDQTDRWIVDTTPDSYTQRAGLPWVPTIYSGTADDFLAMVEAGPAGISVFTAPVNETPITPAPTTAERIATAQAANKYTDALAEMSRVTLNTDIPSAKREEMMRAWESKNPDALPDLLRAIEQIKLNTRVETVHQAFDAAQRDALGRKDEPSAQSSDWVDSISPAIISDSQWLHLQELCNEIGLNLDEFESYCRDKGKIAPALPNAKPLPRPLRGLLAEAYDLIEPILADATRRRSFIAAVKQHCTAPKNQAA